MKQKDIALIAVIVVIGAVLSLVVSKSIFATPQDRQQQVEVIEPISADFPTPDKRYFNKDALDPTKVITIGETANPNPFSSTNGQ